MNKLHWKVNLAPLFLPIVYIRVADTSILDINDNIVIRARSSGDSPWLERTVCRLHSKRLGGSWLAEISNIRSACKLTEQTINLGHWTELDVGLFGPEMNVSV